MRIFEHHDADGELVAIEVDSAIGKWGLIKLFQSLPDAIVREVASTPFSRDEFLEIEIKGTKFRAHEPFGDSSRYWIGPNIFVRDPGIDAIGEFLREVRMPTWIGLVVFFRKSAIWILILVVFVRWGWSQF